METASVVTISVLLFVFTASQADNSGESKYNELKQKYNMVVNEVVDLRKTVKTMEKDVKRVKRMKKDMKRMKKIYRALIALCEELNSEEENSNIYESEEKIEVTDVTHFTQCIKDDVTSYVESTPIHLTSVKIYNKSFSVEYNSTSEPHVEVMKWNIEDIEDHSEVDVSFSEGQGFVNGSAIDGVLIMTVGHYSTFLPVRSERNDSEVSLPYLEMVTDVKDEIVFEPGKPTVVRVKINKKGTAGFYFSYGMNIMNRTESETVINIMENSPGIVNKTEVKKSLLHDEHVLLINKNQDDYEGTLILRFSTLRMDVYSLSLFLPVRRSDHSKPYPDGFLGFLTQRHTGINEVCETYSSCLLQPTIAGNDPADITLWRIRNGTVKQANVLTMKFPYMNMLEAYFIISNVSRSDAGRYMYLGISYSGTVIEKEFEVSVTVPFVLLREKSEVVKDTPEELVVRCAGQGYPDPQIRFYNGSYNYDYNEITAGPGISIDPITESDEEIIATLTLRPNYNTTSHITCIILPVNENYPSDQFVVYDKAT